MLRNPFDWIISRYFQGIRNKLINENPNFIFKNKIGEHLTDLLIKDFLRGAVNGFWKFKYKSNYKFIPLLTEEFQDSLRVLFTILNNVLDLQFSDNDIANEVNKYKNTYKNEGKNKHNKLIDVKSIVQINQFIYENNMDIVYSEAKRKFLNLKNRIATKSGLDEYLINNSKADKAQKVELRINNVQKNNKRAKLHI